MSQDSVKTSRRNIKRRGKLKTTISTDSLLATTSLLSEISHHRSSCSCDENSLRVENDCQASVLSQSSNAFWHRNAKANEKKQQRNNSTVSETQTTSSKTIRQSIVDRLKRNKKKNTPTITARSILRKRTNTHLMHPNLNSIQPSTTMELNFDQPVLIQSDTLHSIYDNASEDDANPTLEPTIVSCQSEQQNINATNNTDRSNQGISMQDQSSSRRTKSVSSRTNRSTVNSTKRTRKSPKKTRVSKTKRHNSRQFLSNNRRKIFPHCPFPDPNFFHSLPPMQDSDELTKENIRQNHLCCKPITSVKGLSASDQKKLIDHDYLTLISLLPTYLGSQGNFQRKIHEKTQISTDGAAELNRLMSEWGSARLFISSNNPYKTLTQKI